MVAGIVVLGIDPPIPSPARRKMLAKGAATHVPLAELDAIREQWLATKADFDAATRQSIEEAASAFRGTIEYREQLIEHLRPQIQMTLGQVHDYRQLVAQIIQNMNVIFERRDPGLPIDQQLTRASNEEAAIYHSARLIEQRLNAAMFLLYPERIADARNFTSFNLHGLVTKYRRIYARTFEAKSLHSETRGSSRQEIHGNPDAIGVIPQTLIDNAQKYAPHNSTIRFDFDEDDESVRFAVTSYGPEITPDETERIFEPFYRGKAAREVATEGQGFGLALARLVADRSSIHLDVHQNPGDLRSGLRLTTFSATFPIRRPARHVGRHRNGRAR